MAPIGRLVSDSRWRSVRKALLAVLAALLLPGCADSDPSTRKIEIRGRQFVLELALDEETRQQGLMHREYIAPNGGMLFVFPDAGPYPREFWMGHCLVDLDIIFLDAGQRITAMHHMKRERAIRPGESEEEYEWSLPRYSSRLPILFAIELAGGTLETFEPPLRIGERLAFEAEDLKERVR